MSSLHQPIYPNQKKSQAFDPIDEYSDEQDSSKSNDLEVLASTSLVLNRNKEIKMTVDEQIQYRGTREPHLKDKENRYQDEHLLFRFIHIFRS